MLRNPIDSLTSARDVSRRGFVATATWASLAPVALVRGTVDAAWAGAHGRAATRGAVEGGSRLTRLIR